MTKRQIKKQSKNIIAGRKVTGVVFSTEERAPRTDGTVIITEKIPVSIRVYRNVLDIQRERLGYYPSHWDTPFIVNIWFADEEGVA